MPPKRRAFKVRTAAREDILSLIELNRAAHPNAGYWECATPIDSVGATG
jgi:hypothetical protein